MRHRSYVDQNTHDTYVEHYAMMERRNEKLQAALDDAQNEIARMQAENMELRQSRPLTVCA